METNLTIHSNKQPVFYWISVAVLSAIFLLTAYPYSYEQAISKGFGDISDYIAIANVNDIDQLYDFSLTHAFHRIERWPVHYLMGSLARVVSVDVWTVERLAVVFGMFLSALLIFNLQSFSNWKKIAFYGLLIFSPYAFRQYYSAAGMLSDCYFYVAVLGVAVGMWNRQYALLTFALVISCFMRQTSILLLPMIIIYGYLFRVKFVQILTITFIGLVAFLAMKYLNSKVFNSNANTAYVLTHTLGIFYWLAKSPNMVEFVDFAGRYVLMLLSLSPLLFLVRSINKQGLGLVLFFFMMHIQPLLGGPEITGSNIDRLSIYGLPFLGLLLADGVESSKYSLIFIGLLFIESLLPNFSILYGIPHGRYIYLISVIIIFITSILIRKHWLLNHQSTINSLSK